ncbi:MAG: caspase family protein [Pirellulales bacterium]
MFTSFRWLRLAAVLVLVGIPIPASAQRLHALLVSDQSPAAHWGTYAPHVSLDMQRMTWLLRDNLPPAQVVRETLVFTRDRDATPARVLAAIERLTPDANDTVLFYYSGHGAADDDGHYLALAGGPLHRHTLRTALERHGARLVVLLTDCCNLRSDGRRMVAMAPAPPEPPPLPPPLFRSLFFTPSGIVDINASSPGEAAYFAASPEDQGIDSWGSLFTRAVSRFVDQHLQEETTWHDLLAEVSFGVHVGFRDGYPQGAKALDGQALQRDQNVYASDYPGKPTSEGSRTGIVFMERARGVEIAQLESGSPGRRAFDLRTQEYVELHPGQRIVAANGQVTERLDQLADVVRNSPQVLRLRVAEPDGETREILLRLRF